MRHCPDCGTEYEDFARECMDCHVALAAGPAPEVAETADVKLIVIRKFMGFRAAAEVEVVRIFLEAHGIPCVVTGVNLARLTSEPLDVRLLVREEDAERAVEILDSCSDDAATENEGL